MCPPQHAAPVLGFLLAAGLPAATQAPQYQVDPLWPKPLPNRWGIGQAAGIATDSRDHVWVIHRPRTMTEDERGTGLIPPRSECRIPAPSVIEFDPDGNLVQARGGPGHHPAWPGNEHSIHLDHRDRAWIAGIGGNDHVLLAFARTGWSVSSSGAPITTCRCPLPFRGLASEGCATPRSGGTDRGPRRTATRLCGAFLGNSIAAESSLLGCQPSRSWPRRRYGLRDDQWQRIGDLLPGREGHVGVTAPGNRLFVEAVLYRYRAGIPWRHLPERFGDWKNTHRRFSRWAASGAWERVLEHLAADADNEDAMLDSTIVRAHRRSAGAQENSARTRRSGARAADRAADPRPGRCAWQPRRLLPDRRTGP